MAASSVAARETVPDCGAYLTDGKRLWCVVAAHDKMVALEDCQDPDRPPEWVGVKVLLSRNLRAVRRRFA